MFLRRGLDENMRKKLEAALALARTYEVEPQARTVLPGTAAPR